MGDIIKSLAKGGFMLRSRRPYLGTAFSGHEDLKSQAMVNRRLRVCGFALVCGQHEGNMECFHNIV